MRRRGFVAGGLAALTVVVAGLPGRVAAGDTHSLWRVSDATHHVYLQGSVHLLKKSNYPLPAVIEAAYADSAVLVLEADLAAAHDPATQMAMMRKGMLKDKATLKGTLSATTWDMAEKQLGEMGMNIAMFNGFKPWFFAMTITVSRLQMLGFSSFDGLDWHFFNRATADAKPVVGLETLDYQMELFDTIAAADQDALVRQTIQDIATIEDEMDVVVDAWATGNLPKLEAALLKNFKEYPAVYKRLVTDRNHNWIPLIRKQLDSGKVHMIVVGAGHLAGKEGLVALLKKAGLQLKQL